MEHYVVVLEWIDEDGGNGVSVLGVKHTLEEAKEIFKETYEEEKNLAEENGWQIYTDSDVEFDAGESGRYCVNHSRLYIQGVM